MAFCENAGIKYRFGREKTFLWINMDPKANPHDGRFEVANDLATFNLIKFYRQSFSIGDFRSLLAADHNLERFETLTSQGLTE